MILRRRFSHFRTLVTATVPTSEPDRLVAGDTWRWEKTVADYPTGTGWVLSYSINGPSQLLAANVTVEEVGSVYSVTVPANKSAALLPGTYRWAAHVSKDSERYTIEEGVFIVDRNLATAAAGDAQPHAEKMLSLIESVLEGRIPADVDQYQIAGRQITKIPVAELKRLRSQYRHELWRLRNNGRLGPTIKMKFARAQ